VRVVAYGLPGRVIETNIHRPLPFRFRHGLTLRMDEMRAAITSATSNTIPAISSALKFSLVLPSATGESV